VKLLSIQIHILFLLCFIVRLKDEIFILLIFLYEIVSLAGQLGLPGGLDGWEQLSRQMGENEGVAEA
jgi:hypothetical protein